MRNASAASSAGRQGLMDADSYYLIGVILAALLALANGWRGSVLIRQGQRKAGNKHLLYSAAMAMFMVALMVSRLG